MAIDQCVTVMCLLAFRRHLSALAIAPVVGTMLVFPARAQSNSDYWIQNTSPAGVLDQSELNRPLTSPTPATPKASSNSVVPTAKTKASAGRVESNAAGAHPESKLGIKKAGSAILINIDKANQKMTVFLDGVEKYDWPVSTGKAGYSTPSGTYTATSMNEIWHSKEWDNAAMPHSIFFMKDGHAIHGSYEVKNLGRPASHGCVRMPHDLAAEFYARVQVGTPVEVIGDARMATRLRRALPIVQSGESGNTVSFYSPPAKPRRHFLFW